MASTSQFGFKWDLNQFSELAIKKDGWMAAVEVEQNKQWALSWSCRAPKWFLYETKCFSWEVELHFVDEEWILNAWSW